MGGQYGPSELATIKVLMDSPQRDAAADALCAPGYTGPRCSECAQDHYRLAAACKRCAQNTVLLAAVVAAVVVLTAVLGVVLSRLRLSYAPLTIAVDYFQVLGRQEIGRAHV